MNMKWLLAFLLFAALCVAAMKAQADDTAIGHISANVVQIVSVGIGADGQPIVSLPEPMYYDVQFIPGVGVLINF